jgi:putative transposase
MVANRKENKMPVRKNVIETNSVYHIYNRSIGAIDILSRQSDRDRLLKAILYYNSTAEKPKYSFSALYCPYTNSEDPSDTKLVTIIGYCFMPTHFHLILRQDHDNGITLLMRKVLNSYSSYFNRHHERKGPLWEGRFYSVPVTSDEQLLHLSRYVHLNPLKAALVSSPEKWESSSCREYSGLAKNRICVPIGPLDMPPDKYKRFLYHSGNGTVPGMVEEVCG